VPDISIDVVEQSFAVELRTGMPSLGTLLAQLASTPLASIGTLTQHAALIGNSSGKPAEYHTGAKGRALLALADDAALAAEVVARVAGQAIAPAQVNATTHVNAPVLQIGGTDILARANTWTALNTFERSVNATTDLMIARNASAGSSAIAVSRVRNDANVEGRWLVGGSANTTAVVNAITRSNMVELTASGTGLQALLTGTLVAGAPMIFVTGGYNERMRLLDAGLAIGATALVGSERFRAAGGSAATSGATDVLLGGGVLDFGTSLRYRGTKVVDSRKTGWAAATGTATRSTFATGTVTTEQLAERVKALLDDLISHGLIGA